MTDFIVPLDQMADDDWIHSDFIAWDLGITTKTLRNWIGLGKYPEGEHETENPQGRLRWRVGVHKGWKGAHPQA
jgi:hypothetical protein